MSRGFKRDIPGTKAAKFLDKRSFRSIDGHDLLFGADKGVRRQQIMDRDGQNCRVCGAHALERLGMGEWRHLENEHNNFRRCDCMEGGQWAHHSCHFKADHPGVIWSKRT